MVTSASLLVSCTSPGKLAGVIAKVGKLFDFSEHLQHLMITEDSQGFFPAGHLHSPGVTSGFNTTISAGVEGQLA